MKKILISLAWLSAILVACTTPSTEVPLHPVTERSATALPLTEVILPIGDGGLITGQPCQSPCFFGIRIAETPLDQVVSSLGNSGIASCSMSSNTTVFCGEKTISIAIGADPLTFLVDGIQYAPSVPVTVEEILEKYGNPNFVQVLSGDIPEVPKTSVLLLWDSIKMRVDLPEIEEQSYTVENKTQTQWIIFLDETSYAKLAAGEYVQSWKGYGIYKP
jgi:hypothetical protein